MLETIRSNPSTFLILIVAAMYVAAAIDCNLRR